MLRPRRRGGVGVGIAGADQCARPHVPEVIPLRIAAEEEFVPNITARAFAAARDSAVAFLEFRIQFLVDYRDLASVYSILLPPDMAQKPVSNRKAY